MEERDDPYFFWAADATLSDGARITLEPAHIILHQAFGRGVIEQIGENRLLITFDKGGRKELSIEDCLRIHALSLPSTGQQIIGWTAYAKPQPRDDSGWDLRFLDHIPNGWRPKYPDHPTLDSGYWDDDPDMASVAGGGGGISLFD